MLNSFKMFRKINAYTRNPDKLREIQRLLPGIEIVAYDLEIPEIQSLDPVEVALAKAKEAYQKSGRQAGIIEDVSLAISCLNGLPGPFIDSFMKTLGNEGILRILKGEENRRAKATIVVVFIDEKGEPHVFEGETEGIISEEILGEGFGWDPIFIPDGSQLTFAQMGPSEKDKFSMRAKALAKLREYLEGGTKS